MSRNTNCMPIEAREHVLRASEGTRPPTFRMDDGTLLGLFAYSRWNGDHFGWGFDKSRVPAVYDILAGR